MTGCTSVKVAKEITKATNSIKTSINKIAKSQEEVITKPQEEVAEVTIQKDEQIILTKKKQITEDKQKVRKIVSKQKKISTIKLLGKTMKELNLIIGHPQLIRKDRNTITARFDSESCRIFVFMNSVVKKPRVEYYELRNGIGELINKQKDIEKCFKEIRQV